jgi:hypothetical protein
MDEVERKLTTELGVEERRSVFTWLRRRMSHD